MLCNHIFYLIWFILFNDFFPYIHHHLQSAYSPVSKSGSPFSIAICVMTFTARKTIWCFSIGCLKTLSRILHCLFLLLTISCLPITRFRYALLSWGWRIPAGVLQNSGSPVVYPLSASTLSYLSKLSSRPFDLNIIQSLMTPLGNGPFIQKMSPVIMFRATSYLRPGPLNLWEYQRFDHSLS